MTPFPALVLLTALTLSLTSAAPTSFNSKRYLLPRIQGDHDFNFLDLVKNVANVVDGNPSKPGDWFQRLGSLARSISTNTNDESGEYIASFFDGAGDLIDKRYNDYGQ